MKNIRNYILSHSGIVFPMFIGVILFLIPQVFWGNLYNIGGDDSKLYYLFPWEFVTRFALNLVGDNVMGVKSFYYSQAYFIPLFSLFAAVKTFLPFIHIQHFFMGLNLVFGFVFFRKFLGELVNHRSSGWNHIRTIGSVFYVLSPFLLKTVYTHQLISIYLVSTIPAILYLFLMGIKRDKAVYTILACIVYAVFSTGMNTVPWFAGTVVTLLPLGIYLAFSYRMRFIKQILLFGFISFFLNFYWEAPFLYPFLSKNVTSGNLGGVGNQNFLEGTANLIMALSRLNSPLNQFFATIRSSWADIPSYPASYTLNGLFFLTILLAGITVSKASSVKTLYAVSVLCLLWCFFLIAPAFGPWSVSLYVFLAQHVPLFSIFRNMFDKFGIAMAFSYAMTLSISLLILRESTFMRKIMMPVMAGLSLLIFANAAAYLLPVYTDNRYSSRISGVFNKDYTNLTTYVRSMNATSRFLWLPLNVANYVYISDEKTDNHYYFGPSPLLLLTGATDYTGILSFGTAFDHSNAILVKDYLAKHNFQALGNFLRDNNVGYIIENKEVLSPERKKYLFDLDLFELQGEEFRSAIIGQKLKDFGSRYSLYGINSVFAGHKIFLSDTKDPAENFSFPVSFRKLDSSKYEIILPPFDGKKYLMFRETYNAGWRLYSDATAIRVLAVNNIFVNDVTNIFELDGAAYSGKILTLYFYPQNFSNIGNVVSAVSVCGVAGYIIFSFRRKKSKKI